MKSKRILTAFKQKNDGMYTYIFIVLSINMKAFWRIIFSHFSCSVLQHLFSLYDYSLYYNTYNF